MLNLRELMGKHSHFVLPRLHELFSTTLHCLVKTYTHALLYPMVYDVCLSEITLFIYKLLCTMPIIWYSAYPSTENVQPSDFAIKYLLKCKIYVVNILYTIPCVLSSMPTTRLTWKAAVFVDNVIFSTFFFCPFYITVHKHWCRVLSLSFFMQPNAELISNSHTSVQLLSRHYSLRSTCPQYYKQYNFLLQHFIQLR